MTDIPKFIWAVLNNWAGYSTGGLMVASVALWAVWRDKPTPRNLMLLLSLGFLLAAFYKAWDGQYMENQVGREVGSLAFVSLNGEFNQHGDQADPQLQLALKNIQPRLIETHVKSM